MNLQADPPASASVSGATAVDKRPSVDDLADSLLETNQRAATVPAMTRWQYAWLRDEPELSVFFSHAQGPSLIPELAAILGPMLYAQNSTEWVLALDRNRVNMPYLAGLLGDRGWELVSVNSKLMPGALSPSHVQTTWYFKKPISEG